MKCVHAFLSLLALSLPVALAHPPDERPDLFEGDIRAPPSDGFRSALYERTRLWDNGIVPYKFSEHSDFDRDERANITAAMEEFHQHTCIRWVPRTDEEDYILFVTGNGCSSNVGKLRMSIKITQRIVLGWGCYRTGLIMHEMMHTIGFFHEQSRWDRDNYVRILDHNVKQGAIEQFRTHRLEDQYKKLGPYDYASIMHYRKDTFSAKGEDTILPLKEGVKIGQREGFSDLDIYKINKLYRCPGHVSATLSPDAWTTPAPIDHRPQYPLGQKTEFGCTFDQKTACDFHDEMDSDLDWEIGEGASSRSGSTGPSADASNDTCCYMHIRAIAHGPGESARLVGPFLKARTPSCLSFYYHMKGDSIGTLRVYIRDYRGRERGVVFERTGELSSSWQRANVPVSHYMPFQLVFEATIGGDRFFSYDANIAIDSVRYNRAVNGTC